MINAALFGWPVVAAVLAMRLYWPHALLAILVGGYLLLPEQGGINLPLIPTFDKASIPSIIAVILALLLRPGQQTNPYSGPQENETPSAQPGWLPRSLIVQGLLAVFILGTLATAMTNGDRITFAATDYFRPGLTLYDGFSMALAALPMILPLLLGRKFFAHPDTHITLLWGLVIMGLAYSLPTLFEIRMSPRLNLWVYGFFPHDWQQHIRSGGFRPVVFLRHGLLLAIFMAMVAVAVFGLSRVDKKRRGLLILAGLWIMGTLVLSNSLTGLLVAALLVPIVLILGARGQLMVAAVIAGIVLLYPMLRNADLIPTDRIVSVAEQIDPSRALSLNFRFENEELILAHAHDRPVFGWGSFGRNRLYDDLGRGIDTVDGAWVVAFTSGGWVRYLTQFGLMALPLIVFAIRRRRFEVTMATSVLSLMLAANMIDLIPNAGLSPVTWLIAGALLGRLELGQVRVEDPTAAQAASTPRTQPAYALARDRSPETDLDASAAMAGTEDLDLDPDTVDSALAPYTRQRKRHIRERPRAAPKRKRSLS
ncbi:hypothetical protein V8J82_23440 [Gymnodinialimonas sp. 2305UL16-5]|uniref:hypothetical protein n=1 Tax=Gymnodinialimonas mytili TaxID=3126503 RepID=UPI0030A00A39